MWGSHGLDLDSDIFTPILLNTEADFWCEKSNVLYWLGQCFLSLNFWAPWCDPWWSHNSAFAYIQQTRSPTECFHWHQSWGKKNKSGYFRENDQALEIWLLASLCSKLACSVFCSLNFIRLVDSAGQKCLQSRSLRTWYLFSGFGYRMPFLMSPETWWGSCMSPGSFTRQPFVALVAIFKWLLPKYETKQTNLKIPIWMLESSQWI